MRAPTADPAAADGRGLWRGCLSGLFRARIAATSPAVAVQNAPPIWAGRCRADLKRLRERCRTRRRQGRGRRPWHPPHRRDRRRPTAHPGRRGGLEMTDCLRVGCEGLVLAPDIAPVVSQWQAATMPGPRRFTPAPCRPSPSPCSRWKTSSPMAKRMFAANASGWRSMTIAPCLPATPFSGGGNGQPLGRGAARSATGQGRRHPPQVRPPRLDRRRLGHLGAARVWAMARGSGAGQRPPRIGACSRLTPDAYETGAAGPDQTMA